MGTALIRRGRAVVVAALAAAALLSACGGGGGGATQTPAAPAEPAAAVDPSSDNVITGPVNKAKETAEAQEAHDRAIEGTIGGQP